MSGVRFLKPLAGLGDTVDFELTESDEVRGLYTLRSADGLRLFLIDADRTVPGYEPVFEESELLAAFGSAEPAEFALLAVATIGEEGLVANLLAPIVLHRASGTAAQIILRDDRWPVRAVLGSSRVA